MTTFHLVQIHRSRINVEEMRSGIASTKPKDVPFYEALKDPDTRAEYIRRTCLFLREVLVLIMIDSQISRNFSGGLKLLLHPYLSRLAGCPIVCDSWRAKRFFS
jgi:hypothetical protein